MANSMVTLKRDGRIMIGDFQVGTYKYHKLGGRDASGNKLIPYYYSMELADGLKTETYTRKDVREITENRLLRITRKDLVCIVK
jgi:hypothetical protein